MIKKILNHSFWLLVGNSIGRLAMFLTNIVAARMLSQETFGQFMMIRNTISMLEGVISGSLGSPMIKRVAEVSHQDKEHLKIVISTLFLVNIAIALFFTILLFFTAPFIVHTFFIGVANLVYGLYLGALLLIATTMATMIQNILTGFEEYKKLAFSGIISSILSFPIILFLIEKFSFNGAILGVTVYFTIDFIVKLLQFKRVYKENVFHCNCKLIFSETKKLLIFSSPLLVTFIINSFTFWYARIFIINENHNFNEIAIFDAAYQWQSIIMIITGATTSVILPMLSKNLIGNKVDTNKIFNLNLIVNFFIAFIFASFFVIFAKNIMLIYGENYLSGKNVLIILAINSIFFSLASVYNRYFIAISMPLAILASVSISAITMGISLLQNYFSGAEKLAIGFLVFYVSNTIIFVLTKKMKVL